MDRQRAAGRPVVVGEASPYYCFHPLALDRIAARLPDVRMIIVLRDPVERAWSQYSYEVARGNEDLSFAEALDAEAERFAGAEERIRSGRESPTTAIGGSTRTSPGATTRSRSPRCTSGSRPHSSTWSSARSSSPGLSR